jgi:hypothetical protein
VLLILITVSSRAKCEFFLTKSDELLSFIYSCAFVYWVEKAGLF